jgi:hypothetical protein
MTLILKCGKHELELSPREARDLYHQLREVFEPEKPRCDVEFATRTVAAQYVPREITDPGAYPQKPPPHPWPGSVQCGERMRKPE